MTRISYISSFVISTLLLTGLCEKVLGQNTGIAVDEAVHDYGVLENVNLLQSEFIVKNNSDKNLYFLRADVAKNLKVRINKKALLPGDTSMLTVIYQPGNTGNFNEKIKLVTSASGDPFVLAIKGTIKSIRIDNTTACFNFSSKNRNNQEVAGLQVILPVEKKPDLPQQIPVEEKKAVDSIPKNNVEPLPSIELLDNRLYKPNNIVFLIDVSGSMGDSLKLPLMKKALHFLIKNLRDIDKITFITYADSVSLVHEATPGTAKKELETIVNGLHSKGYTKGAKAILYALDIALNNYIPEGNNQIFMATDGKFAFYEGHYKQWVEKQGDKKIILSAIAFGNDHAAIKNLKDIAAKGKGSFIRIKNSQQAESAILDEVKLRSKKD